MMFFLSTALLRINDKCPVSLMSVRRSLVGLEIVGGIVVFVVVRVVEVVELECR